MMTTFTKNVRNLLRTAFQQDNDRKITKKSEQRIQG